MKFCFKVFVRIAVIRDTIYPRSRSDTAKPRAFIRNIINVGIECEIGVERDQWNVIRKITKIATFKHSASFFQKSWRKERNYEPSVARRYKRLNESCEATSQRLSLAFSLDTTSLDYQRVSILALETRSFNRYAKSNLR